MKSVNPVNKPNSLIKRKKTTNSNNKENPTSDYGKTFDELVIENVNFVYSVVNKEFKHYPWDVKQELYSAGKERISLRCY